VSNNRTNKTKTLSVNIVSDNMHGEESRSCFYRELPRLSTFHYQCSRSSTSKEVASVFDKAIQRQQKVDASKHKCLVFMDEAGLPEEEKESLKVLHYYLEGHMSMKAKVAFVAITNHVLDAAKSNRCVSLLRQEPDKDEMMRITNGVLFGSYGDLKINVQMVLYKEVKLHKEEVSSRLCGAYTTVLNYNDKELETFFGLRDFIYFLKHLRLNCHVEDMLMRLCPEKIVRGIERNFNGIHHKTLLSIASIFISSLSSNGNSSISSMMRQPMIVMSDALKDLGMYSGLKRYTLIIDETEDDSIVRLLHSEGLVDTSQKCLFKLSKMPENSHLEETNLVSGVKYAALQGTKIVLSQTDSINESFYDLFNQHFRQVTKRGGESLLFANIAIGGVSRRSRVSPSFHCIVHVRLSDLHTLPAPFLNRFEKYRLDVRSVLDHKVSSSRFLARIISRSVENVKHFTSIMETKNLCGYSKDSTIESFYLNLIEKLNINNNEGTKALSRNTFLELVVNFVNTALSIIVRFEEITAIVDFASECLPLEQVETLQELLSMTVIENPNEMKTHFQRVVVGSPDTLIAQVIENIIEMIITKRAINAILSLATPEAIFSKR
jgi:hypothetical protein